MKSLNLSLDSPYVEMPKITNIVDNDAYIDKRKRNISSKFSSAKSSSKYGSSKHGNVSGGGFLGEIPAPAISTLLSGLLAYWTLQDNFGEVEVYDVNGLNPLVNGTFQSYEPAKIGNGARIPNNNVLQENVLNPEFNLNEFTVSFWFKQNSNNNFSIYNLIRKLGDDGGGNDGWALQVSVLDNVDFVLFKNGVPFAPTQIGPISDGVLYFFALRYRLSDSKAIISFYDELGLIAQNEEVNSNYEPSTTTKLIMGDSPSGLNITFDELAIWNRALTDGEVNTLWNNGAGLAYPFS